MSSNAHHLTLFTPNSPMYLTQKPEQLKGGTLNKLILRYDQKQKLSSPLKQGRKKESRASELIDNPWGFAPLCMDRQWCCAATFQNLLWPAPPGDVHKMFT